MGLMLFLKRHTRTNACTHMHTYTILKADKEKYSYSNWLNKFVNLRPNVIKEIITQEEKKAKGTESGVT